MCATAAYDGVRGTWKPSSEMGIGEYCGQKALGCPLVGASASTLCVCAERDNVVNTSAECNAGGSLARWRARSLALVLCVAVCGTHAIPRVFGELCVGGDPGV